MNKPVAKKDDYIIVPIEESNLTKGGLYVPDTAKKRINNGVVISKGRETVEDIELGDHVVFNGRSGDQITLVGSGRFFVVPESHIIAKLKNSSVRIVDLETVKRVIRERLSEVIVNGIEATNAPKFAESLIDRLDHLTTSEGMDF